MCVSLALIGLVALPLIGAVSTESSLAGALARESGVMVERTGLTTVATFASFNDRIDHIVSNRMGSDLVALSDSATTGPLRVATVNDVAPPSSVQAPQLRASYVDHLASHVVMLAGQLPPDALGGGDMAATMPQRGADQLGLHLSDHVCLSFVGPPGPGICVRIVGLWRPVDDHDPIWAGTVPRLQLAIARHDLFSSVVPRSPQPVVGTLRYQPNAFSIGRNRLGEVSARLGELRHDLEGQPGVHTSITLDRTLDRLAKIQDQAASTIWLLTGSLVLIGLALVALVCGRYVDVQTDDLHSLRAHGWSPGQLWGLLFARLAALAALALPAGLVLGGALGWAITLVDPSALVSMLRGADLIGISAMVAGGFVALIVTLAGYAAIAAQRDASGAALTEPGGSGVPWRPRVALGVLCGGLSAASLALAHSPAVEGDSGTALANVAAGAVPIAAEGLLAVTAICLQPLWARVPRRSRTSMAGTLAGWQLDRRPDQHAALVFLLIASIGFGGLAAYTLAIDAGGWAGTGASDLQWGLEAALAVSLGLTLLLAVTGFGLHFRGVARQRVQEYASLFSVNLPRPTVAASLVTEQTLVLRSGLAPGIVSGLILIVILRPLVPSGPIWVLAAAAGLFAVSIIVALAATVAGRPGRQVAAGDARRTRALPPR